MKFDKKLIKNLPDSPGVYKFLDEKRDIIYIGKSVSIKKRVSSYFKSKGLGVKTDLLVSKISDVKYIKVFSEFEALLLEAELIKKYQPFFNVEAKDDKSPLYIRITDDKVPQIIIVRRENSKGGVFLKGPFKSAKSARLVLRLIRRIFPYCHHSNPKKPCLYVHLDLCPYPFASKEGVNKYSETIRKIKRLLSGNIKGLIKDLAREMKILSNNQLFEQADIIKNQISKLEDLQNTFHEPREFIERPTLVDDLVMIRLQDLASVLELERIPRRIESYDISNIGGKFTVGSMIVFMYGQASKQDYRRFKIKHTDGPDDYGMLREVIYRRLKNKWTLPDLFVIDGGKGQLNAAKEIIGKFHIDISVIAIAKRFERIFTLSKDLPIVLEKNSPARKLVQSMRDEAHRFAVLYHRKLRAKNMISN